MSEPTLAETDREIFDLIDKEAVRQRDQIRLIASENYVSRAVLEATGSVLTNKYSEGYAGRRYYEGQENIDEIERLAIERAKAVFSADHANVQPYSGSPANLAAYTALMKPGETLLGMGLPAGGHLTHGWKVSATGKFWNAVQYGVRRDDHLIDFDEVAALAREHRPQVIVCGATAYPRRIDFGRFREIADEVGAYLVADMAHISGLVAGGAHPSPVPHADVVTTTTHKTLRGPRGGMILCKEEHAKKVDRAVFPGLQGGPHNHTTAALAVALREASQATFEEYAAHIVANARALAEALTDEGFEVVTGGTDNHLVLVDVTPLGATGKPMARAMARAGLVANYNSIPFDTRKPMDPSGMRLGTAAVTSRGFGPDEMRAIASWMARVAKDPADEATQAAIADEVRGLCDAFPPPGIHLA
ncbi:MAG: serine hydroxymethyltransferase [Myxococcota bacterium]